RRSGHERPAPGAEAPCHGRCHPALHSLPPGIRADLAVDRRPRSRYHGGRGSHEMRLNVRRLSRLCLLPAAALLLAVAPPTARAAAARELGFDRPGDLPEVKANADEPLVIEKLRFTDCRTAQGFTT